MQRQRKLTYNTNHPRSGIRFYICWDKLCGFGLAIVNRLSYLAEKSLCAVTPTRIQFLLFIGCSLQFFLEVLSELQLPQA
jgi:hypothetical protein